MKIFRRKSFCLRVPKNLVGKTSVLCFGKIPLAKNSMDNRGAIKFFRRNFFVTQPRNFSQGNPFVLCFRKLLVSNKIMNKRREGV